MNFGDKPSLSDQHRISGSRGQLMMSGSSAVTMLMVSRYRRRRRLRGQESAAALIRRACGEFRLI